MSAELPPDAVGDWLAERQWGQPPPIFAVDLDTRLSAGNDVATTLRDAFGARTSAVAGTGTVRFRIPDEGRGRDDTDKLAEGLIAACTAADDRWYRRQDPSDRGALVVDVRSTFAEADLPAIGPGGGAMAFADARGVAGAVVVRRRTGILIHGKWRSPQDVLDAIARTAPSGDRDFQVLVELGYFEAGPGVVQEVIRPAYLFVFDSPQPEGPGAGWRRALVIPATTDGQHPLSLGIESWWEGD
jgi:hypothetical protein